MSVTNPSSTETAEVDLEIVADGDLRFDPVELTIRPGRTVTVTEGSVLAVEGGKQTQVATMLATMMAIHGRDDVTE